MIQNYQAAHGGVVYYRAPSARDRARRMRLAAVAVTAAFGFSAGLLQQFHDRPNQTARLGEAQSPLPNAPLATLPH